MLSKASSASDRKIVSQQCLDREASGNRISKSIDQSFCAELEEPCYSKLNLLEGRRSSSEQSVFGPMSLLRVVVRTTLVIDRHSKSCGWDSGLTSLTSSQSVRSFSTWSSRQRIVQSELHHGSPIQAQTIWLTLCGVWTKQRRMDQVRPGNNPQTWEMMSRWQIVEWTHQCITAERWRPPPEQFAICVCSQNRWKAFVHASVTSLRWKRHVLRQRVSFQGCHSSNQVQGRMRGADKRATRTKRCYVWGPRKISGSVVDAKNRLTRWTQPRPTRTRWACWPAATNTSSSSGLIVSGCSSAARIFDSAIKPGKKMKREGRVKFAGCQRWGGGQSTYCGKISEGNLSVPERKDMVSQETETATFISTRRICRGANQERFRCFLLIYMMCTSIIVEVPCQFLSCVFEVMVRVTLGSF